MKTQKYKNFDMAFNNPDWQSYFQEWTKAGGLASDLIEYAACACGCGVFVCMCMSVLAGVGARER